MEDQRGGQRQPETGCDVTTKRLIFVGLLGLVLLAIGVAAFFQVFHVNPFWRSVSTVTGGLAQRQAVAGFFGIEPPIDLLAAAA